LTISDCQAPVLIDQGTADGFLDSQLKPKNFALAAANAGYNVEVFTIVVSLSMIF
jgi:S-formylglutathione hydrolase FrmB